MDTRPESDSVLGDVGDSESVLAVACSGAEFDALSGTGVTGSTWCDKLAPCFHDLGWDVRIVKYSWDFSGWTAVVQE